MQYPGAHGAASLSSGVRNSNDALEVLAATASNDQQLRERYHRDGDQSSNSSPLGNGGDNPCSNTKSISDVNSEDDESESSAGFSKRTGLRKGKWTVSRWFMFMLFSAILAILCGHDILNFICIAQPIQSGGRRRICYEIHTLLQLRLTNYARRQDASSVFGRKATLRSNAHHQEICRGILPW
jgi:hypothetical protein